MILILFDDDVDRTGDSVMDERRIDDCFLNTRFVCIFAEKVMNDKGEDPSSEVTSATVVRKERSVCAANVS